MDTVHLRPSHKEGTQSLEAVITRVAGEGYTHTRRTRRMGQWVGEKRVLTLWAFYHPDGRITTHEYLKGWVCGSTMHGYEVHLRTESELEEYLSAMKIELSDVQFSMDEMRRLFTSAH